jgi:multidrug efflux pump subunit AcrB
MARWSQAMIAEMQKNPGIVQPDSDLQLNKPEIFMDVDRNRAADMGVSVDAVARTVETMLGGRVVTRYKRDADQYDVMVQTDGPRPHHARGHREALRARPRRHHGAAVSRWSRCARRSARAS